jgi:GIY-YIG catalytic domain
MVVYVLKLHNNKFYVGRTNNLNARYAQHKNGFGSAWTKKHGVVSIVNTYDNDSPFYEDMVVKIMMHKHGIANVRGGSYSMVHLTDAQLKLLQAEIRGANDCCFKCGGNHFIRNCPQKDIPEIWNTINGYATQAYNYISSFWL